MSDPAGKLDPVGDLSAERTAGLLQKYHGRVLMIMTGACAVHCRYCFRRHFPYSNAPKGRDGWLGNLQMIASDPSIEEVILSGGDPLTLADESLRWLVVQLNDIPHIRRIRLHTRLPVVIPQRVCGELEQWIKESNAAIFVVLHFNHAQEVDSRVTDALRRLHSSGATLLNQSVLLRGVNDTFDAQRELCLQLVNQRVLPYYLHLLDPVQGGMHFTVPDAEGQKIIEQLRHHLPGYAVPTLVREIAGQPSKTPI
jgi:EF-P beta-lysylation protein EpmB